MRVLAGFCEEELVKRTSVANIRSVIRLAMSQNSSRLMEQAKMFIRSNWAKLVKNGTILEKIMTEFPQLMADAIKEHIEANELTEGASNGIDDDDDDDDIGSDDDDPAE